MPNDPLARYHFTDDHGHQLENCVEYRELLAENERLREEVARLNKEADWLGLRLWGTGGVPPVEDFDVRADRIKMWRKAARKSVEEKERYG